MMYQSVLFRLVVTLLVIVSVTACGGSGSDQKTTAQVDITPSSGSTIGADQAILLEFDRTMSPASLVLGGAMAPEASPAWSVSSTTNDTLTLSPTTAWSEATNRSLLIDVQDANGVSIDQLALVYSVDATAPTILNVDPANNATIGGGSQIAIVFSESMKPASLTTGGSMQAAAGTAVWSTTSAANDTLTLSPTTTWGSGAQTLTIDATDIAGNAVSTLNLAYTVDTSAPSANVNPANGSIITATNAIVLVFNESMSTASLSLGGSLAAESDGGAWSQTSVANDTLTISPATTWTAGIRSLSIDVTDTQGNPLALALTFDADVVFVALSGNNGNGGGHSDPLRNVNAGLQKAQASLVKNVWIGSGSFGEIVTLLPGIKLQGGYDASWVLVASGASQTTIIGAKDGSNGFVTLHAPNLTQQTVVSDLILQGANASGSCGSRACSSYVVHATGTSQLTLQRVDIISGDGANGSLGNGGSNLPPPGSSANGGSGGNADSFATACDATSRGGGGSSGIGATSQSNGGSGGNGGTMDTNCSGLNFNATAGLAGSNANTTQGPLGTAGPGGAVCAAGQNGQNGVNGSHGSGGVRPVSLGSIGAGYWLPSNGGNGANGAAAGGGGGGGGSGGCDTGTDSYGAGGGGGGAGGRGNTTPGTGGGAGGWSFGIFATGGGTINLTDVSIQRGNGGSGGSGGKGGTGQGGGTGGNGGLGAGGSFAGGDGGDGGTGGSSGGGAGGNGGGSYGIATDGTVVINPTVPINFIAGGFGGSGGAGGAAASGGGNSGQSGLAGPAINSGTL